MVPCKDTVTSCNQKTKNAVDQSQDLVMKIAVLRRNLKAQPKAGCCTKVRTLVGKTRDPGAWERNLWINALRNLESQISLNLLNLKRCPVSPC